MGVCLSLLGERWSNLIIFLVIPFVTCITMAISPIESILFLNFLFLIEDKIFSAFLFSALIKA